jgi:hypothetical protein
LQMYVLRFVALQQEVIEIKLGHDVAVTLELDIAQRTLWIRPTRGEQRI